MQNVQIIFKLGPGDKVSLVLTPEMFEATRALIDPIHAAIQDTGRCVTLIGRRHFVGAVPEDVDLVTLLFRNLAPIDDTEIDDEQWSVYVCCEACDLPPSSLEEVEALTAVVRARSSLQTPLGTA